MDYSAVNTYILKYSVMEISVQSRRDRNHQHKACNKKDDYRFLNIHMGLLFVPIFLSC